ncbi:hypothetical protein LX32DRAFT_636120 [Colletotrichum zoysiae]|uniref:Uncharacterized protein n=1 Tax=Colletotrichum zoysiae TaxID=1216348 RepID=A0AAD9M7X1_9PEZI|nr:hypothetical protein LX32DRAFT_636120 [Colletotrichum zoysiae]
MTDHTPVVSWVLACLAVCWSGLTGQGVVVNYLPTYLPAYLRKHAVSVPYGTVGE